jgi:hypothetical protein
MHGMFLEDQPLTDMLTVKRLLEGQTILNSLGAGKPKNLNSVSKIGYDRLHLREINLN